jgi:hypothetical protein
MVRSLICVLWNPGKDTSPQNLKLIMCVRYGTFSSVWDLSWSNYDAVATFKLLQSTCQRVDAGRIPPPHEPPVKLTDCHTLLSSELLIQRKVTHKYKLNICYREKLFCMFISKGKKGKVVPVLNLIKHYAMKAYGGVDV